MYNLPEKTNTYLWAQIDTDKYVQIPLSMVDESPPLSGIKEITKVFPLSVKRDVVESIANWYEYGVFSNNYIFEQIDLVNFLGLQSVWNPILYHCNRILTQKRPEDIAKMLNLEDEPMDEVLPLF